MSLLLLAALAPAPADIVVTGRGLQDDPAGEQRLLIGREQLETTASGRMEEVVRSVAGLTSFRRSDARSSHPTSQGLTARGLGGNAASRFAVEVDGVPQADPFGGWINFVALDPGLIDRLILTRGGASGVRLGSGAVAGSLRIDSDAIADGSARGALSVGSRESFAAHARMGHEIGSARLVAGAAFARSDGFVPIIAGDRGLVDRAAPFRQMSGRVRLLTPIGDNTLQLNLSGFDDRRDRGVDFTDNRGRGVDASARLVGRDWSLLAYGQRRRFESQFASVAPGRVSVSAALDQHHVPASGWGLRALWQPRLGRVDAALGADLRQTDGETNEFYFFQAGVPGRSRNAGARTRTAGLFADADVEFGRTRFGAGARIDHWSVRDAFLSERNIGGSVITDARFDGRNGTTWSLRAGAEHRLGERLSVRAAAYRSWRLPTVNELVRPFRVGPDATAANPELEPERLLGVEAGLDWRPASGTRVSGVIFANRLRGAIANVPLGEGPGAFPGVGFVAAGGIYRQRRNLDAISSRGVEVDGEWRLGEFALRSSLALTRARIEASDAAAALDGLRPAQSPAFQASAGGTWERQGRLAALSARYSGPQDESEGDERPLPSFWTLDAVGRWPLGRGWSLDLRAENLLDHRVVSSVLPDGRTERALPRTLWIGLRLD